MEKLDDDMSPETVVGDFGCLFLNTHTDGGIAVPIDAVALVFVKDKNKPIGIGETQFHSVSSRALLPLGIAYEITSVLKMPYSELTLFTARREGSHENFNLEIILGQAFEEVQRQKRCWYIGATKRRKYSTGKEKVDLMTSFAFHRVLSNKQEYLQVDGLDLETGDTFRFYLPDSATALSSCASVSNHLRSFKQGSTSASGGNNREVFGGLIFSSCTQNESFFGQASIDSSSFLDNFPGVTLGVILCDSRIGRGDLTAYVEGSQQQKSVLSCVNESGAAYLIMSYTPYKGN